MAAWTRDELTTIGTAEEVQIAGRQHDGTLRKPVTIWIVRYGDDLYIRSVNGRNAAWFRGILLRHEGRIWAGGVEKDVSFADTDDQINDELDAVYDTKYPHYPSSVDHITSPEARTATLKLVPR